MIFRTVHIIRRSVLVVFFFLIILCAIFILRIPQRFVRAVAFLSDVQGERAPDWVQPIYFSTRRDEVFIDPPSFRACIYRPVVKDKTAGIVLIPGLAPNGIDDPRLEVLARAIARQGFTVLAPDIADFRRFQVAEEGITAIIRATKFMIENMPDVDPAKVGLYGISYSAGPALIAASREELADKVAFVFSIGGYYHLLDSIEYVLTGTYRMDDKQITLQPHPWARMIFALNNLDLITSGDDLPKLRKALRCRLQLDEACAKQWEMRLSAEGRELISLILGPVNPQLYERMSSALARVSDLADSLSPAVVLTPAALKRMQARIYLLHGANDDVIPCSETWRLAQALKQRGHPAQYVLISKGITHADSAGKDLTWYQKLVEGFKLVLLMMAIMNEG